MFWLGGFLGYIVGSVTTCALLYFGYRSNENKKADMQKERGEKSIKRCIVCERKVDNIDAKIKDSYIFYMITMYCPAYSF